VWPTCTIPCVNGWGRASPQRLVLAILAGVVAVVVLRHVSHVVSGALVVLIGLSGFYTAAALNEEKLARHREAPWPLMLTRMIASTSLRLARINYVVLGVLICALGAFGIFR